MILIQQALLRCFPIDELVMIERLELGPFSQGWLVEVKRQGLQERWFVKRHRAKAKQRLELELTAADRLRAGGLELIPRVIPTVSGSFLFSADDGDCSAHIFINADPPGNWMGTAPLDLQRASSAGAALSRFHRACLSLPAQLPAGWQKQCAPWLAEIGMWASKALAQARLSLPENDAVAELLRSRASQLEENLEAALAKAKASKQEPVLIHGDYHPGNVLFKGAKVLAILDLEYLQLGWPAYDVAYAAYMFGRDWHSQNDGDGCLAPFLAGYEGFAGEPLYGVEDFQMLPPFLVGYWLLERYCGQPHLRSTIEPVLRAALQDAAGIIENPLLRL